MAGVDRPTMISQLPLGRRGWEKPLLQRPTIVLGTKTPKVDPPAKGRIGEFIDKPRNPAKASA